MRAERLGKTGLGLETIRETRMRGGKRLDEEQGRKG
jgi:hypothetical protein